MNLKRFGVPAVIAVTAAIALSSCAANEGGAAARGVGLVALGHPRRRRRVLAGRRPAGVDRRLPDREPRRDHRLRPARAPARAARPSSRARATSPVPTARSTTRRSPRAASRRARPTPTSSSSRSTSRRSPSSSTSRASTRSTSTRRPSRASSRATITKWNDQAIVALNPDATLPDLAITPVHRSDDSGTTENFTDYLGAAAPDVWTYEADGVWPFEGGEAAQGTSGVVDAVTNGTGTIGYADASRAGDLGTVAVQVGDEFVAYSPEAAAAIVDASPRPRAVPRATSRSRSTAPPRRPASTRSCSSATSSAASEYADADERRAREVVLLVHRQRRGPGRRG